MELVNNFAYNKNMALGHLILGIQQESGSISPKEGYYWGSGDNISEVYWCTTESGAEHGENENILFLRVNENQGCFVDSHPNFPTYFVCEQGDFRYSLV